MQKAERENGNTPPPIDILSTVSGVLAGDQDDMERFDGLLRPKLSRFFSRFNPQISEDLAQDTIIKVFNALPTFDPNLGEGGKYEKKFWGWVFTIGRNIMINNHRREVKQGITTTVPIDENTQYPDAKEDDEAGKEWFYQIDDQMILNLIKSRFPSLLTRREQDITELRVAGKKNKKIAELQNSTEGAIRVMMTRARVKIESEILEKIGFKPTDVFKDVGFQQAVVCGRVRSIKILGRYYTRKDEVNAYNRKLHIGQELLGKGYVLLSQDATLSEYFHFRYSEVLLRHNGRLYIKTDDLEEFRKGYKNRRKKRVFPPSPSHKRLAGLCQTYAQWERAIKAIKTGRLVKIKNRGSIFVKEEDFSTWVETLGK
ncbi:MAG: hypothetical protein A3H50_03255 [Candidatus Levybacteria bacterium RIFCSPLOWO2_02_FULL_37_10]|nr:MAG: hypothetical protein A2860_02980 [Candidatus Levybacteria bacterium RIFCSPHIGHO2_01_FULL_37_33]OGH16242.1 MAG: hypothetical protein A3C97_02970 [Candidatus Levybacteria bacterium RIFCSPHIGHO2_02_FULL_37_11]OGH29502.1 MAG: hypothetical protein A3F30_02605 [Candidatus Levybacteria bacterium RIFCSPHIGHO2_12_FULL_37_12]OGH43612.1 MAG: hypothetical protein A3H50_03255 [Candidatus Levybacteria bacterium RIFCSPLOWO2_02_FULL_37_10]